MHPATPPRTAIVLATLAVVVCGSARPVSAAPLAAEASGGGGVSLPASFPRAVPLPTGRLTAVGTGPRRWSVLLKTTGAAPVVERRAIRFYVAHGYVKDSTSRVHRHGYRVDMTAENRDHAATSSNLTLVVYRL